MANTVESPENVVSTVLSHIPGLSYVESAWLSARDTATRASALFNDMVLIGDLRRYNPEVDAREELSRERQFLEVLSIAAFQTAINAQFPDSRVKFLSDLQMADCARITQDLQQFEQATSEGSTNAGIFKRNGDVELRNGDLLLRRVQVDRMTSAERLRIEVSGTRDEVMDLFLKDVNHTADPDNAFMQSVFYPYMDYRQTRNRLLKELHTPIKETALEGVTTWDLIQNAVTKYVNASDQNIPSERAELFGNAMEIVANDYLQSCIEDLRRRASSNDWAYRRANKKGLFRVLNAVVTLGGLGLTFEPFLADFAANQGVTIPEFNFSVDGTTLDQLAQLAHINLATFRLDAGLVLTGIGVAYAIMAIAKARVEAVEDGVSRAKELEKKAALRREQNVLIGLMRADYGMPTRRDS